MKRAYHEKSVHGTPVFPLQVYSNHDKDGFYFVPQHWHEEYEWVYTEYGTLNLTIHGKPYTLGPGEFCFINAGELHEIKSIGESLHHAVVFHPGFLDFALYDICQHNFIRPVTSQKILFPSPETLLPMEMHTQIAGHLQEIIALYHTPSTGAYLSIKIRILQILELLFQSNSFQENTATPKEEDSLNKLKKVIEYVQKSYASPIALKDLAEICFMSPNYFCHYFRREIGKTPIAFVNEYRIEKACQLLSESDIPISDISLTVGFDNFSYFIRKFREYKGVTPKAYRLSQREFTKI